MLPTRQVSWTCGFSAAIAVGALAVGYANGPSHRLQRGIEALAAHDGERLHYQFLGLDRVRGYESRAALIGGALLLEEGKPKRALEEFELAVEHPQTRAYALTLAGRALYELNRFREAEHNWLRALEIDPNLADAHRWLASAYYDIGLMTRALDHLERIAELEPADGRPHRVMGVIRLDFGNAAAAVDAYEESLRRDPHQDDRQEILLELADAQTHLHRYSAALQTLAVCDPSADSLALAAECHLNLGRPHDAQRDLRRAAAMDPARRLVFLMQAELAKSAGHLREATDILSRAADAFPTDYDIHYRLATVVRQQGDEARAAALMEHAEGLQKARQTFHELHEAAIGRPYDPDVRFQLGRLASDLGMPDLASTWFEATLKLDPNHALARSQLPPSTAPPGTAKTRRGFTWLPAM